MRRLLLASVLLAAACSPASAATRSFPVGGFDRIRSSGPFDVRVRTGAAPSARASGDRARLDQLVIEVTDGELRIGTRPGWNGGGNWSWGDHNRTIVEVTVPALRAATLAGSGDVTIDHIRARSFDGALAGSGNLAIASLEADQVSLSLTGSGDVTAAGRAGRAALALRGSGDMRVAKLAVVDGSIDLRGSGGIDAAISRTAQVALAGSGDVTIAGHPRCTIARHGSGEVTCG